jgi:hypothetical protein
MYAWMFLCVLVCILLCRYVCTYILLLACMRARSWGKTLKCSVARFIFYILFSSVGMFWAIIGWTVYVKTGEGRRKKGRKWRSMSVERIMWEWNEGDKGTKWINGGRNVSFRTTQSNLLSTEFRVTVCITQSNCMCSLPVKEVSLFCITQFRLGVCSSNVCRSTHIENCMR